MAAGRWVPICGAFREGSSVLDGDQNGAEAAAALWVPRSSPLPPRVAPLMAIALWCPCVPRAIGTPPKPVRDPPNPWGISRGKETPQIYGDSADSKATTEP